jgi:hypothetical protein
VKYETLETEADAMRLPRVQFTVRWMMVAVTVVGLLAGLGIEGERRRERFREEAIHHLVIRSDGERARQVWAQLPTVFHERVAAIDAWLSYHERMEEKYDWAARFPCFPSRPTRRNRDLTGFPPTRRGRDRTTPTKMGLLTREAFRPTLPDSESRTSRL